MCEFCGSGRKRAKLDGYQFEKGSDDEQLMMGDDGNGIWLRTNKMMWIENSGGKCRPGVVEIAYCPFCGRSL